MKTEWRKIFSAPNDGTKFIAYDPKRKSMAIVNQPLGHSLGNWDKMKNGRWGGSAVSFFAPSHWMPLPATPQTAKEGE
jgi:hypothetical protein